MPRKLRMYLAGIPCHVIQRGNNHNACFFAENDYRMYLDYLQDACRRYHVGIHAYVLMTNHVHLLMTPDDSSGIYRVMQSLGRRYVQKINTLNVARSNIGLA
jgi:putative transposase